MKNLLVVFVLSLSLQSAHAGLVDDLKEKARPFLVQLLGQQKVDQLLGADPNNISMPEIPEVVKNATKVVEDPKEKEIKISKDDQKKYNFVFVKEAFEAARKMQANDNDLAKWMNVMNQGASREGVYRALVLDNLYAGLENHDNVVTEEVVNFAIDYYARFLRREVTKEKLSDVNFYYLKRVTVERSLELADTFIQKNESDLHRWYAVLSGELAQKFGNVFKSDIRKDSSMKRHYQWAQNVPRQYLKSELIVKLHKIFNHLQP